MPDRILITPNRVSISKPGYDVNTVPRTNQYMSVDSALGMPLRVTQTGIRLNYTIQDMQLSPVLYGQTYAEIPRVVCLPFETSGSYSTIRNLFQKWINGNGQNYFFYPYNVNMQKDRFTVSRADGMNGQYDNNYYQAVQFHWFWVVFP